MKITIDMSTISKAELERRLDRVYARIEAEQPSPTPAPQPATFAAVSGKE